MEIAQQLTAVAIGLCMGLAFMGTLAIFIVFLLPEKRRPARVIAKKKHLKLISGGRR